MDSTNSSRTQEQHSNNGSSFAAKKLQMSFADWKKSKAPPARGTEHNFINKRPQMQQQPQQQQRRSAMGGNKHNLAPPLMSINLNGNNYTPPMLGNGNGHRSLQPTPFWQDMMAPMQRQPPIQPPMPPPVRFENHRSWKQQKTKQYHTNMNRGNRNENRTQQINETPKNRNEQQSSGASGVKVEATTIDSELNAAILMPPPPPPPLPGSTGGSNSSTSTEQLKKKNYNPKAMTTWMPKPVPPPPIDDKDPGTKEERQRQWKEYRQAMKPFKNREFHNAKRCVQRLGKLPLHELDEKQRERLQKSEQFIAAHKAMLSVKHAERWVQKESADSDLAGKAQIYVRKPISTFWEKWNSPDASNNTFRKHLPVKQYSGPGRAIRGGHSLISKTTEPATDIPTQKPPDSPDFFGQHFRSTFDPAPGGETSSSYFSSNYGSHFVQGDTLLPGTF